MKKKKVYWDVECYRNYFYVKFKSSDQDYEVRLFNDQLEKGDPKVVRTILKRHLLIGFNTENYDTPMLAAFLAGYNNSQLKDLSDAIITSGKPWWMLRDNYPGLRLPSFDGIDLNGVTPLRASLKTYACRIHTQSLEDLPLPPGTVIQQEQVAILESYCDNDLDMTRDIAIDMADDLRLRADMTREYSSDFRSKSGPQIAEAVLRNQLNLAGVAVEKRRGRVKPFKYRMPDFIKFKTPELKAVKKAVKKAVFKVDKNGYARLPDELDQVIEFAGAKYKLGIGGLHSQEKHQAVVADTDALGEWDVGSMYPTIILGQGLYPEHIGPEFCDVYRRVYDTRMAAKAKGDKVVSDSLKLVLNSSFGKFGSHYSFLYSPELLIQTTLTGQLSLLMLIEMFHLAGIPTMSANTDGVVVLTDKSMGPVVRTWQERTGMTLEWTPYDAIYSESVNSYVAIRAGGGAKLKGTYAPGSIAKGYQNEICVDAVVALLEHGVPIKDTVMACDDVTKFLTMRGVRDGGVWRDQQLGRVVRWYVSTDGEPIRYRSNGNKVAGSDGAVPMMTLGPIPADLDRQWYVDRAEKLLTKLGVKA